MEEREAKSKDDTLIKEYRTEVIKLLINNYVFIFLIANQDVEWTYTFKDFETSSRMGREIPTPKVVPQFGVMYRLITLVLNTMLIIPITRPVKRYRHYLLLPILWNLFSITAIFANLLELCLVLNELNVSWIFFYTLLLVGVFVICLQSGSTLQVLLFYDHLNSQIS